MRFGDISNRSAPIIAFNIDNLLFTSSAPETGLLSKLSALFNVKKVDYVFLDILNNIWTKYDLSVYLVTGTDSTELMYNVLDENSICYTDIIKYHGIDNLRRLVDNRFFLYVDCDEQIISQIGRKNAIHIKDLPNYLPVGGK